MRPQTLLIYSNAVNNNNSSNNNVNSNNSGLTVYDGTPNTEIV